jgi:hypothetical protein
MLLTHVPLPVLLPCKTSSLSFTCILALSDNTVIAPRLLMLVFYVAFDVFRRFEATVAVGTMFRMFVGLFVFAGGLG